MVILGKQQKRRWSSQVEVCSWISSTIEKLEANAIMYVKSSWCMHEVYMWQARQVRSSWSCQGGV
jgi:hypothetical protein